MATRTSNSSPCFLRVADASAASSASKIISLSTPFSLETASTAIKISLFMVLLDSSSLRPQSDRSRRCERGFECLEDYFLVDTLLVGDRVNRHQNFFIHGPFRLLVTPAAIRSESPMRARLRVPRRLFPCRHPSRWRPRQPPSKFLYSWSF